MISLLRSSNRGPGREGGWDCQAHVQELRLQAGPGPHKNTKFSGFLYDERRQLQLGEESKGGGTSVALQTQN